MARLYPDPFGPPWKFQWVRTLCAWEGGIFQLFWIEWLCATAICALCLTITFFALRDNNATEIPDTVVSLAEACDFVANRFQAALGLMLGFFTVQCFARWREVRNTANGVFRTINNLALQIAWNLPDAILLDAVEEHEESEEKKHDSSEDEVYKETYPTVDSIRTKLVRWLNLSHAIVVGQLYETKDFDFCSLEKIRENGLATELEYKVLKAKRTGYRYAAPLVWYVDFLNLLQRKELYGVDAAVVGALTGPILEIRSTLEDLYQLRNTPIPLAYRQLTNFVARFYMAILFMDACLAQVIKQDEAGLGSLSTGAFWFIMVFAFEYFLFVGWLTVADALGNPFRCWSDDYDWERLVKALYNSSLQLVSGLRDEQSTLMSLQKTEIDKERMLSERVSTVWKDLTLLDPPKPKKSPREGFTDTRRKLTGF